jgi:hypothetical protein
LHPGYPNALSVAPPDRLSATKSHRSGARQQAIPVEAGNSNRPFALQTQQLVAEPPRLGQRSRLDSSSALRNFPRARSVPGSTPRRRLRRRGISSPATRCPVPVSQPSCFPVPRLPSRAFTLRDRRLKTAQQPEACLDEPPDFLSLPASAVF